MSRTSDTNCSIKKKEISKKNEYEKDNEFNFQQKLVRRESVAGGGRIGGEPLSMTFESTCYIKYKWLNER